LEFAAECWYMPGDALSSGTVDIIRGPLSSGSPQWRLRIIDTGAVTATMITNISTYTATTATGLIVGGSGTWSHLVATVTDGNLRVYVDGVQMASTAVSGVMGAMTADSEMRVHDSGADSGSLYDEVAVYRHGLTADRVTAHYQAGRERGFAQQQAGARIEAILDSVQSLAPRDIDAGARFVLPAYMRGQDPLSAIRATVSVDSPDGLFFASRDGTLVFLENGHRATSPHDTVQATFDDDGTDLPYLDVEFDYSEAFLRNHWTVTRAGFDAVPQEASDSTSIARYLERPAGASDLPLVNDTDAEEIADALLAKYKEPLVRITSITFSTANPDLAETLLPRELGDRIRVFRTPPGGGSRIDQTLFIQAIEIAAANDRAPWRIKWAVSPL
jgi:hypothetical protein